MQHLSTLHTFLQQKFLKKKTANTWTFTLFSPRQSETISDAIPKQCSQKLNSISDMTFTLSFTIFSCHRAVKDLNVTVTWTEYLFNKLQNVEDSNRQTIKKTTLNTHSITQYPATNARKKNNKHLALSGQRYFNSQVIT